MTTVFMTKGTYILVPVPRRVKFRLLGHVILCLDMASKFKKKTNTYSYYAYYYIIVITFSTLLAYDMWSVNLERFFLYYTINNQNVKFFLNVV